MASALNNDVFGYKRNPKPRGVFSSENSVLVFGGDQGIDVGNANSLGFLVQNWQVQYTQQVQEIFEIGSNELYWVKGRPAGQGTISRLLGDADADTPTGGPGGAAKGFFPKSAYDICDGGATMVLKAAGGHCKNPVVQDQGSSTQGQQAGAPVVLNKGIDITMSGCVVTSIGFSMAVGDVRLVENYVWRFAYMQLIAAQLTNAQEA